MQMHQSNLNYMLQIFSFLILFAFLNESTYTQNLIPNPGFEQETIITDSDTNCIKYLFPHWKSLKNEGCGVYGTNFFDFREYLKVYNAMLIDYIENWDRDYDGKKYGDGMPDFKDDGKHLYFYKYDSAVKQIAKVSIDTSNRYYKAKNGNCYIKNSLSFRKELFQVKLKEPLKKESCYRFKMSYFFPDFYVNEPSLISSGQFGAFFTNADFTDEKYLNIIDDITYKPQILIENLDSSALKGWVEYSEVFTAKDNWKYLIIGNHQPFNSSDLQSPITFHIDNVMVEKYKCKEPEYGIIGSTFTNPNILFNCEYIEGKWVYKNIKNSYFEFKDDSLFYYLRNNNQWERVIRDKYYCKKEGDTLFCNSSDNFFSAMFINYKSCIVWCSFKSYIDAFHIAEVDVVQNGKVINDKKTGLVDYKSDVIILPYGFTGVFAIAFNQKDGESVKFDSCGQRVFCFSDTSDLFISTVAKENIFNIATQNIKVYYSKSSNSLEEIPVISKFMLINGDDFIDSSVYVVNMGFNRIGRKRINNVLKRSIEGNIAFFKVGKHPELLTNYDELKFR